MIYEGELICFPYETRIINKKNLGKNFFFFYSAQLILHV